jgi:hypothetical protein
MGIETVKQGSRQSYDSQAASSRQCLNAEVVRKGKTSGFVLHGLVYVHKCTLLVNFHIYDTKKNPDRGTRYLKITEILSL